MIVGLADIGEDSGLHDLGAEHDTGELDGLQCQQVLGALVGRACVRNQMIEPLHVDLQRPPDDLHLCDHRSHPRKHPHANADDDQATGDPGNGGDDEQRNDLEHDSLQTHRLPACTSSMACL